LNDRYWWKQTFAIAIQEVEILNRDSGSRNFALEVRHLNDRYTLQSGHWAKLVVNGR
jgi:hypothetical protein